jgi:hypothetical protein
MRKIVVMSQTLAGSDEWWDGMPKEFQEKYIKEHPNSKYAKNAAKQKSAKLDRNEKDLMPSKKKKDVKAPVAKAPAKPKKVKVTKEEVKPYRNPGKDALKKYRDEQAAKKAAKNSDVPAAKPAKTTEQTEKTKKGRMNRLNADMKKKNAAAAPAKGKKADATKVKARIDQRTKQLEKANTLIKKYTKEKDTAKVAELKEKAKAIKERLAHYAKLLK